MVKTRKKAVQGLMALLGAPVAKAKAATRPDGNALLGKTMRCQLSVEGKGKAIVDVQFGAKVTRGPKGGKVVKSTLDGIPVKLHLSDLARLNAGSFTRFKLEGTLVTLKQA